GARDLWTFWGRDRLRRRPLQRRVLPRIRASLRGIPTKRMALPVRPDGSPRGGPPARSTRAVRRVPHAVALYHPRRRSECPKSARSCEPRGGRSDPWRRRCARVSPIGTTTELASRECPLDRLACLTRMAALLVRGAAGRRRATSPDHRRDGHRGARPSPHLANPRDALPRDRV